MNSPTHQAAIGPTLTWVLLIVLAALSLTLARHGHTYAWIGGIVALLTWTKAILVARAFLEVQRASPVFRRVVLIFISVAPVGLALTAWLERAPLR
ncbi:MAG: cytochrome C oxidase subunit IV family protein [Burkholderiales bacterium]|nr:cytochrome C oxidase subunit IV family protein [Burkholderiales bacterium]